MKTALITGASKRIGKQIALTLHKKYNIIIHYNSSETAATELESKLNTMRMNSAKIIYANLAQENKIEQLVANIQDIDLLVNNASCFYPTPIENISSDDFHRQINTNVLAPLLLSTKLATILAKNKGSIVNIVDIYAERPLKNYSIYSISKAGIAMLTKTLARELAPNIRVNGISPGNILWPENATELTIKDKEKIIHNIPLNKQGSSQDIANAVLFLAEADYITGQILNIDGGRTLSQ